MLLRENLALLFFGVGFVRHELAPFIASVAAVALTVGCAILYLRHRLHATPVVRDGFFLAGVAGAISLVQEAQSNRGEQTDALTLRSEVVARSANFAVVGLSVVLRDELEARVARGLAVGGVRKETLVARGSCHEAEVRKADLFFDELEAGRAPQAGVVVIDHAVGQFRVVACATGKDEARIADDAAVPIPDVAVILDSFAADAGSEAVGLVIFLAFLAHGGNVELLALVFLRGLVDHAAGSLRAHRRHPLLALKAVSLLVLDFAPFYLYKLAEQVAGVELVYEWIAGVTSRAVQFARQTVVVEGPLGPAGVNRKQNQSKPKAHLFVFEPELIAYVL